MKVREDFTIGHPADAVWSLLADRDQAAACVPGLDPAARRLVLAVGDDSLDLIGTATVRMRPGDRVCHLELRGEEPAGRGKARARLDVSVEGGGLFSTVHVDADVTLGGELADMPRTGWLTEAAYRLADGFAECVERRLGAALGRASGTDTAPAEAGAVRPAEPAERPGWLQRVIGLLRRHG